MQIKSIGDCCVINVSNPTSLVIEKDDYFDDEVILNFLHINLSSQYIPYSVETTI